MWQVNELSNILLYTHHDDGKLNDYKIIKM